MVRHFKHGETLALLTDTPEGRAELQREGKLLLDLTPSLSSHLHYAVMRDFSTKADLEWWEAVILYSFTCSLRVARHEAAHTAALVLLHEPNLYTLHGAEFNFSTEDQTITLSINGNEEVMYLVLQGGVNTYFAEGNEIALAAVTCIRAPERLEPPMVFSVQGEVFKHGGMGESDWVQEARIRKLLIGEGVPAAESVRITDQRLEEDVEMLLGGVDVLASYFYARFMTGQKSFCRDEIVAELRSYSALPSPTP